MDGYDRGGHTKYSLKAHVIFVTKYRKPIFRNAGLSDDVKQFLYDACQRYGYRIIQMEADTDHVHLLVAYRPDTCISNIALNLKRHSTYQMWRRHGTYLSKQYWKHKVLWSDGYFASSIGQVSQATVEHYIQNKINEGRLGK